MSFYAYEQVVHYNVRDKKHTSAQNSSAVVTTSSPHIKDSPEFLKEEGTYDMAVKLNLFDIRLFRYAQQQHCRTVLGKSKKRCVSMFPTKKSKKSHI